MICAHCGIEDKDSGHLKPRSNPQLRRYFKMIKLAWMHWPEKDAKQYVNEEDFRKRLQMAAGRREVGAVIPLNGLPAKLVAPLMDAALKASGSYAVPVVHNDKVVVYRPGSIAFDKLSHHEACQLFDEVSALIEKRLGVSVNMLMSEAEAAA